MNFSLLLIRLSKLFQVIWSARLLRALFCHRVLAGTEHRSVFSENLATVIDIGANRGQFVLAARHWASKARVIAFEPLNEPAAAFQRVFQGDPGVTLHQSAIGPQTGETIIHVSAADDSSSLLPISPLQERVFPGTGEIRTEMVKVGSLSDNVSPEEIVPPAMLKIDVQGYELEVLRGCEDLLSKFSHVYVECSFVELYHGQTLADEVVAWLRERGLHLEGTHNITYDNQGRKIQADLLFKNARVAS